MSRPTRSLLFGALALAPLPAFAQTSYEFSLLEPLAGTTGSKGYDINNSGVATGTSLTATDYAVVWSTDGTPKKLGELTPGGYSAGNAINSSGMVVGYARTGGTSYHGFHWTASGGMQAISTSGQLSLLRDVNDSGWAVGERGPVAIRSGAGTSQPLGFLPGGGESTAYGIDSAGRIVGRSSTGVDGSGRQTGYRGFTWTAAGGMQALSTLSGGNTFAHGVNDLGTIVGVSVVGGAFEAVTWNPAGQITKLSRPSNTLQAEAHRINAEGAILGKIYSLTAIDRPVLWTSNGTLVELSTLGENGWSIRDANGINDHGQIVGTAYRDGVARAYVLTPVPEPASLAALVLGSAALLRRRKKRA